MAIQDIEMLFKFVGGLGMFLYGMNAMADGLQKSAGHRMQQLLGVLTSNRLLGVFVGAGVTAIIQSSSATTVMVVGFVNAGIINLTQLHVVLHQALPGCADLCTGIFHPGEKSVFGRAGRRGGDGNHPELLGLRGYFADPGLKRGGQLAVGDLHHPGTEYRNLCDGPALQRGRS